MNSEKLKAIVRYAALEQGVSGVMELTELSTLSYERVAKVWHGNTSAKLADVNEVLGVLGKELKSISKEEL